jgi:Leucine-rich repeat (LRR) protein
MPTIRFENTEEKYKKLAGNLLKSLNLDPEQWLEDQEFELTQEIRIDVFGMQVPIPAKLTGESQWICRIVEQHGSQRLFIEEHLWAADIAADAEPGEAVAALAEDLEVLNLYGLRIKDLGFLAKFSKLTGLNLRGCIGAKALTTLPELNNLSILDLGECKMLTDWSSLSGLTDLTNLNLSGCGFLTDLAPLSELTKLTNLDLSSCRALTKLGPLSGLTNLTSLNLTRCSLLSDLSPLSGLTQLTSLDLRNCQSLSDLKALAGLTNLTSLDLRTQANSSDARSGLRRVVNLGSLSELKNLTYLNLEYMLGLGCDAFDGGILENIEVLSGLTKLTHLNLSGYLNLEDLNALTGLKELTKLELHNCVSLADITGLAGLANITNLGMSRKPMIRRSRPYRTAGKMEIKGSRQFTIHFLPLEDFSPLAKLPLLSGLRLENIDSLSDLSWASGLADLSFLCLDGCEGVRSLDPLSSCQQLKELYLEKCTRLTSIEPVREIPTLSEVEGFHPDQTAELLAHTAVLRGDKRFINGSASRWLRQIQQMDESAPEERERFATTLGEALSLLGESPHEEAYEQYLRERPEFSASPWKAWFSGTREVSGWALLRVRVERQELANVNPGCIGGVCASLHGNSGNGGDDVSKDERQWALDWLGRMEEAWVERGKELVTVAAEICVAHLRHGLDDALGRWLLRLTDESDPASMDPVHVALGEWQLERGQLDAARDHADAIQTPDRRDPLLAELAKHYVADEPQTAGDLLLTISSPPMRRETMELLCEDTSFVVDPLNVERLVVACGDSAEALAGLIAKLPPETDSSLLDELSKALHEGDKNRQELQRTVLQRILVELGG